MKNYLDNEDIIRGRHCRKPGVYRHVPGFPIIKSTKCTKFSNLFWKETLQVSDSSSVHHQEFFTVHTAMLYVIEFC